MKRCRRGEEDEDNSHKKSKFIEQCSTKFSRPWSDLRLDLLGEIKKKLYGADNIRFGSVCKRWKAAQHGKRPGDVLPWLMVLNRENVNEINYYLFEPSAPHLRPVFSESIYLDRFFDISQVDHSSVSFIYRDGCLVITFSNIQATCYYYLLLTVRTKKVVTIPPLRYPYPHSDSAHNYDIFTSVYTNGERNHKTFTAVSTNPTSPDCVFLGVRYANGYILDISTFTHGDGDWTTTEVFSDKLGVPTKDAVFFRGDFYFPLSRGRLGCYGTSSEFIECLDLPSGIDLQHFHKLFGLAQELMVLYYDAEAHKYCVRMFDWEDEVWVPLKSLGNRSLFLCRHSAVNCYGVSDNKIYVRRDRNCYVYSLKNGRLFKCTLSGLRNWDDCDMKDSVWVNPRVFHPN